MTSLLDREEDHQAMTRAALATLSPGERGQLGAEGEMLVRLYCMFPDYNWLNYGEWGGWSGDPDAGWTEDIRREWSISYYCMWDPATGEGPGRIGHPPESYELCRVLFTRALQVLQRGEYVDGIRFLGPLIHHVEDWATYPSMQAIHRRTTFDYTLIDAGDYVPAVLGGDIGAACEGLIARAAQMVAANQGQTKKIRQAIRRDDRSKLARLFAQGCSRGARVVADILRTALHLAAAPGERELPPGENLVANPSFEEDDGSGRPAGWCVLRGDPQDRVGVACREGYIERNEKLTYSGRYSAKLMWTPTAGLEWIQVWRAATPVAAGQKITARVWVKGLKVTGSNSLKIHLYSPRYERIASFEADCGEGSFEWRQVNLPVQVPAGATWARVSCSSRGNRGAVWFDDVSLVQGEPDASPEKHALLRVLDVDLAGKGYRLGDLSPYSRANGPIVCISGTDFADLHSCDSQGQRYLQLDGRDDFVEFPFSRVQDVLNPAPRLVMRVDFQADRWQDAWLVGRHRCGRGFRIDLTHTGRIQLVTGDEVDLEGKYVPGERCQVVVVIGSTERALCVDGFLATRPGAPFQPAPETDLYLGADTGVDRFFAGRIYRLAMWQAPQEENLASVLKTAKGVH